MKTFRIYLLILLLASFLIFNDKLFAGGDKPVISGKITESVFITTDRDLYIAGETILFSAEYFVNGYRSIPQLSNTLYVELISATDNKSLLQKKYKLENHFVAGVLNIPPDVASGVYAVSAYTQFLRNFSEEFFGYQTITILNPKNDTFNNAEVSDKRLTNGLDSVFVPLIANEDIAVETERRKYKPREKVKAKISCNGADDENPVIVSISVVKQGTHKEDHGFLPSVYSVNHAESKALKNEITLNYIPEIRDVSITGKLLNKQTLQPVANHSVYSSVLFNNPQLHVNRTKDDGTFIFSLNNLTGINDVFISPVIYTGDTTEYELRLDNPFSNKHAPLGNVETFVDSSDIELIRELYVNAQIRKQFCPHLLKDTIIRNKSPFANISKFPVTYILSDFVSLKNMEELFTEIVIQVRYKKTKNQYSFLVFNNHGIVISEDPLLLLDKIPIFDPNVIMNLDISQIEKVEVINRPYVLGENTFQGILSISTKNNVLADILKPEAGVFTAYQTIEPEYGPKAFYCNCNSGKTRIPDFRTTLFWNPHIELTKKSLNIEFTTSDDTGAYNIVVKGINNGTPFFKKMKFIVGY